MHVAQSFPGISLWLFLQSVFSEVLETVEQHEASLNQSISNLLQQEDEVQVCSKVPYLFGNGCVLVADETKFYFALPQIMDCEGFFNSWVVSQIFSRFLV